jgi:TnpA family transposase
VFGLCHLLGFRFAPRLRDLSERRLYIVDRRADYGALDCLIGGAINLRKIEENWDEILRMTASIRAGTVAPSVLMRRLAALCLSGCFSNGPSIGSSSTTDTIYGPSEAKS